jgi:hypothetical protein
MSLQLASNDNGGRRAFKTGDGFYAIVDGTTHLVNVRKVYCLYLTDAERNDPRGENKMCMEQVKDFSNRFDRDEAAILNFRLSLIEDAIDSVADGKRLIEKCYEDKVETAPAPLAMAA